MQHDPTTGRFMTVGAHVERACEVCGNVFSAYRSEIERGDGRYCTPACASEAKRAPLADRFWARAVTGEPCWGWTGRVNEGGYGLIDSGRHGVKRDRPLLAHVVSWEIHYGPVPAGRFVLHHCDNPPCSRPDHLWLGTNDDNVADMVAKGRQSRGERRHLAKLTDADVIAIRRRWAAGGVMQKTLAAEYGVSRSVVCEVISQKMWKHL